MSGWLAWTRMFGAVACVAVIRAQACDGVDRLSSAVVDTAPPEVAPAPTNPDDVDGDGVLRGTDCDDTDRGTFPGALERCDGHDDDCDGAIDEDLPTTAWFADADGDSYGDEVPVFTCDGPPAGHVGNHADCDDTRVATHPGAAEVLGNDRDDDCNRYTSDDDDGNASAD